MGKKKPAAKVTPDAYKETGNKAFAAKNYDEAVKQYTQAIELAGDKPNHVYFSNRANAYLELFMFQKSISDCDKAIEIDNTFAKSYFRKAKALSSLDQLVEAKHIAEQAMKLDPENE